MALGDFEYFTPSESLYTKPGAADERARQEAIKKASYLASMDQFYESLDETIREFNKTYKLQERSAALAEKEQGEVSAYRTQALKQEKELAEKGFDLQRESLRQQYTLGLTGYATQLQTARIQGGTTSGGPLVPAESQFEHTSDRLAREEQELRERVLGGGY
jgi:hypothetical protein